MLYTSLYMPPCMPVGEVYPPVYASLWYTRVLASQDPQWYTRVLASQDPRWYTRVYISVYASLGVFVGLTPPCMPPSLPVSLLGMQSRASQSLPLCTFGRNLCAERVPASLFPVSLLGKKVPFCSRVSFLLKVVKTVKTDKSPMFLP